MKKLIIICLLCAVMLPLISCAYVEPNTIYVNAENQESLSGGIFGLRALTSIGNGLYYDSSTRIVYWWNGQTSISHAATTPTPYYAPNGLPYKYNPETRTFEEINY